MKLLAGFGATDITPPLGTQKAGWLKVILADRILDPLFARAAILDDGHGRGISFIQLDTLSVRWTTASQIRQCIEKRTGFPGKNIMIAATHNHAGPAVANVGDSRRDDAYLGELIRRVTDLFAETWANRTDAEIGFGHGLEFGLTVNRRAVMRDGTVKTHAGMADENILHIEGPIDPEVAVLAARAKDGRPLGLIVNFSCHPTHHGATGELSAGFPGALDREMKMRGWPQTVFLNGACGNLIDLTDAGGAERKTKEQIGGILATVVDRNLQRMAYRSQARFGAASRTIQLPYRRYDEDEIRGAIFGAQRAVDSAIYDRNMPRLLERIRERQTQPAEAQALAIDEIVFAAIPAELFVQLGLRIKERAYPRHALIVSHANGMVGYLPHREAFEHGGYETTFNDTSRLAPEAGNMLAEAAIRSIRDLDA